VILLTDRNVKDVIDKERKLRKDLGSCGCQKDSLHFVDSVKDSFRLQAM